jgi:hypothetical protein
MLRWDRYSFDKKHFRTRYVELLFLHPVGSAGHVVHFGASRERTIETIFFKLSWGRYGFDKKRFRTRDAELLFLHPVRSAGQVVHFGASRERIIDTLFFKLGCDRNGLTKSASGHVMLNFIFCIWWDQWVT